MLDGRRPRSKKACAALPDSAKFTGESLRTASMPLALQALSQRDSDRFSHGLAGQPCHFAGEHTGLLVLDVETHFDAPGRSAATISTLRRFVIACRQSRRHQRKPRECETVDLLEMVRTGNWVRTSPLVLQSPLKLPLNDSRTPSTSTADLLCLPPTGRMGCDREALTTPRYKTDNPCWSVAPSRLVALDRERARDRRSHARGRRESENLHDSPRV